MHAWTIPAMPPVFWQIETPLRPIASKLSTTIQEPPSFPNLVGQTVWHATLESGAAAVAWDWTLIRGRVPILQDPLTIVTNLHLRVASTPIHPDHAILYLNRLLSALGWQHKVRRYLRANPLH